MAALCISLSLSLSLYNGPLHPALTDSQRSRGKNTERNKKLINHFVFIDQLLKVDNECTFICILLPFYVSGGWVTFVHISSRYQTHSNWAALFQDLTSEMFNESEVGPHERWVVYLPCTKDAWIGDIWLNPKLDTPIWLLVSAIPAHFPKIWLPSLEFKFDMPPHPPLSVDQIPRLAEPWSGKKWPGCCLLYTSDAADE